MKEADPFLEKVLVVQDDDATQRVLQRLLEVPTAPVIVVSAKSDITRELLARLKTAVGRGPRDVTSERFTFCDVSVDFAKMELTRKGMPVALTAHEFKLLRFFTQNPHRVLSRAELLNEVWGYKNYPSTRTVDNHVWKLRSKLEDDPANPIHLLTVHGAGYKFVP